MNGPRTYLDYNATAPLRPEARAAMLSALDLHGNASSVHAEGRRARQTIEAARVELGRLAGAPARDVIFTSGATEAANQVLSGPWRAILVSAVEHPAVIAAAKRNGAEVIVVPVDHLGLVAGDALATQLDRLSGAQGLRGEDILVAIQQANNETGVVQPIAEIAEIVAGQGARLMVDAVQAAGRIAIAASERRPDYVVLSSHKIGGPLGAGALIAREGAPLTPLLTGGGQERGRRAGTENVAAIAGFGAAAAAAARDLATEPMRLEHLRDRLETELAVAAPDMVVIGRQAQRLCNTTLVALAGAPAETAVIALDLAGVAASAGAACSSGKTTRSPVLAAMGIDDDIARCAVRFSLGWASKMDDVSRAAEAWQRVDRIRGSARQVA